MAMMLYGKTLLMVYLCTAVGTPMDNASANSQLQVTERSKADGSEEKDGLAHTLHSKSGRACVRLLLSVVLALTVMSENAIQVFGIFTGTFALAVFGLSALVMFRRNTCQLLYCQAVLIVIMVLCRMLSASTRISKVLRLIRSRKSEGPYSLPSSRDEGDGEEGSYTYRGLLSQAKEEGRGHDPRAVPAAASTAPRSLDESRDHETLRRPPELSPPPLLHRAAGVPPPPSSSSRTRPPPARAPPAAVGTEPPPARRPLAPSSTLPPPGRALAPLTAMRHLSYSDSSLPPLPDDYLTPADLPLDPGLPPLPDDYLTPRSGQYQFPD